MHWTREFLEALVYPVRLAAQLRTCCHLQCLPFLGTITGYRARYIKVRAACELLADPAAGGGV